MSETITGPEYQIVAPYSPEHTRNGEADIVQLKDGSLFLAYGKWNSGQNDFDFAEVWCKTSTDGGKTWGNDRVLVPNEGKVTTFSVSLLRLQSDEILMAYLVKNSTDDCSIFFRKSGDECRTWSSRIKYEIPPEYSGYTGMNNNRLIQLKNGRIVGAAFDGAYVKGDPMIAFTIYSDDNGATWSKSTDVDIRVIDPTNRHGAQEPCVIELKDGRLMMIIRNNLGSLGRSYSIDHGESWSPFEQIKELNASLSPASIRRIPQTGDLLLIWNNSKTMDRRPLTSAISRDEGVTWENFKVVDDGEVTFWGFAYISITFVGDKVLLTYWNGDASDLKLTSIDYRWFYQQG